ncbi:probable chitinase 10 [Momordica charantia]|uniref:Probable chitinase 10 n=1 Tax=Momordica charantia TaxID=3673 RepID=A0A6J1CN47_MOMCH|nr:probable chitinase 10 [Momordica charantia]
MMTNFVNGGYWLSNEAAQFPADKMDATLYTHLFCGYAEIDIQSYEVIVPFGQYNIVNAFSSQVKLSNPDVKTMLSIRGEKEIFSQMAGNRLTREVFIKSSIKAAVAGNFNGLDLCWLYPSTQDDMENFDYLITEWRQVAEDDARDNNRKASWLLVASVPNAPYVEPNIHVVYPATAISQNLDWVNLISYDFYTPTSCPGYTAPSSAFNNHKANLLSAHFGIDSWSKILGDLPFDKIVFGIPFHGWAWKLTNPLQHNVFSKADGPTESTGEYEIALDGKIVYYEVQNFIHETQAEVVPNDRKFVIAYAFNATTTWIAFESKDTISQKVNLARSMMALGYFASNVAADDELYTLATAAKSSWSS